MSDDKPERLSVLGALAEGGRVSPIISMQRRLHEDGRIRIGEQVPSGKGTRPAALDRFRFTSKNRRAIEAIAAEYGGTVAEAEAQLAGQWEVTTDATDIPVVVPPEQMSFSQWYELWSAGGCQRRCDGEQESISDGPCICDPDARECKPHTRLSVMLAKYPGTGLWRLDTQGFYAATELGGAMEVAGLIEQARGRSVLPGRLRIEKRTVKRPDQPTRQFVVPVLDFEIDMAALATGTIVNNLAALPAAQPALTPVPADDTPAPDTGEQIDSVGGSETGARRRTAAAALPPTGRRPRSAEDVAAEFGAEVEPDTGAPKPTTRAKNKLFAALRDIQVVGDDCHAVVSAYIGRNIASINDLSADECSTAIKAAEGAAAKARSDHQPALQGEPF